MQLDQNILTQLQGLFANLKHQYTLVVDNAGDAKERRARHDGTRLRQHQPPALRPRYVPLTSFASASSVMGRLRVSPSALSLAVTSSPPSSSPSSTLMGRARTSLRGLHPPYRCAEDTSAPDDLRFAQRTNCPEVVQALNVMALYNEASSTRCRRRTLPGRSERPQHQLCPRRLRWRHARTYR